MLDFVIHGNRHVLKSLCGASAGALDLQIWVDWSEQIECVAVKGTAGVVTVKPNDSTLVLFSWKHRKGSMPHLVRGAKFFRLLTSSGFPSLSLFWVSMDFRNVMHCN